MNFLKKLSPFISPVKPMLLHYTMPLFGIVSLLGERKINNTIFITTLFIFFSFFSIDIITFEIISRHLQLFGILMFLNFMLLNSKEIDYGGGAKLLFLIALIFIFIDIALKQYTPASKMLFGLKLEKRYYGLVGESNFTSLTLLGVFLIFVKEKKYSLSLVIIALILFYSSRATFLGMSVFLSLTFVARTFQNHLRKCVICIYFGITLFPVIYGYLHSELDTNMQRKIKFASSERSELYKVYIKIHKEAPLLGHGYLNAYRLLKKDPKKYGWGKSLEQHSTYLQILTDFGIVGFVLFNLFIISFILRISNDSILIITPMLVNMAFLNTLNEVIIYITLAYVIKNENLKLSFLNLKVPKFKLAQNKSSISKL